jgi:1-acyl-sn-glycerol-3-phosphate acyltransferase
MFTHRIVTGKERVPAHGPLLVVANHLNNADPPLIGISLGRKARFMAKDELFRNPLARFVLLSIGAFPVNRRRPGKNSLQEADQALAHGFPLVMFPESTRSKTAKMRTGLPGAAMVAIKSGVPILPIGITGTEKINGPGWWLTRPVIRVSIGMPFTLPAQSQGMTRDDLNDYTGTIMHNIASLLPVEYRGEYA